MPSISEKKLFTNGDIIKAMVVVFSLGTAWARFEYKMNETTDKVIKRIDEHILSDKFEKQIINTKVEELSEMVNKLQDEVAELKHVEFIRPSDTRITKRKNFR